ncbi:MAG: SH3 domain-containing protein, partial [Leptospiraceae bacterium]|nr:SH3 domain-containing protein [Leptospiraceae bacterium]
MKKILLSTAFTILVIFPFNIYSESKNFRVKAANGLNMRSEKGKTSSIITLLPPGSAVKFIEESEEKETLGGKKGNWIKVKYLDHKGWVFSPYLNITESNDPLILYMEFLEKNDSNDLNSLVKARKKFNQIFSNNKNDADNGLRLYRQFS